jgi:hypothetical protein
MKISYKATSVARPATKTPYEVQIGNGSAADFNLDGLQDIAFSLDINGTDKETPTPVGIFTFDKKNTYQKFYITIDDIPKQWPEILFGMYTLTFDFNSDGIPDILPIDQSEVRQTDTSKGIFVGNYQYAYISESIGKYKKIPIGDEKFCVHGWAILKNSDGKIRLAFNTPWTNKTSDGASVVISTYDTAQNSFTTQKITRSDSFFDFTNYGEFFYLAGVDVNNDKNTDIVGFSTSEAENAIYLSNGNGSYTFMKEFSANLIPHIDIEEVAVGDFNGDGFDDIAAMAVNRTNWPQQPTNFKTLRILINDNGSGFVDQTNQWLGKKYENIDASYGYLDIYDINNDGLADFSWARHDSEKSYSSYTFTMFVSSGKSFEINDVKNKIDIRSIPLSSNSLYDGANIVVFSDEKKVTPSIIEIAELIKSSANLAIYKTSTSSYIIANSNLAAGDTPDAYVKLKTSLTKEYLPKGVVGVLKYGDGSFGLFSRSGTGSKVSYSEQLFSTSGIVSGKPAKLTIAQVLSKETSNVLDINGDGAIGDIVTSIFDSNISISHSDKSLYRTTSGNIVVASSNLALGDSANVSTALLATASKPWVVPVGTTLKGVAFTADGGLEVLTLKGRQYSAHKFDTATGLIKGKATTLNTAQLDAREYYYNLDLTGDGEVSLVGQDTMPTGWAL